MQTDLITTNSQVLNNKTPKDKGLFGNVLGTILTGGSQVEVPTVEPSETDTESQRTTMFILVGVLLLAAVGIGFILVNRKK